MTLAATDPGVRVAFGVPKSGKSFAARCDALIASQRQPIIVIDPNHEWMTLPPNVNGRRCRTVRDAALWLAKEGNGIAIVTPSSVIDQAEEAARWTLRGRVTAPRGLVVNEAWMAMPPHVSQRSPLLKLSRVWRHRGASVWYDSQRVAALSRDVSEICTELRLFAIVGDLDLLTIKKIDKAILEPIRVCAQRLAAGERGWHVALEEHRLPPYLLRRMTP